jgi:hypothetical protein
MRSLTIERIRAIVIAPTFVFVFLAGAVVVHTQTTATQVDFNVRGVRLGKPYRMVLKQLGRPLKRRIKTYTGAESCLADSFTLYLLKYPGSVVMLIDEGSKGGPKVLGIEVTSNRMYRSFPRIGATITSVKKLHGEPVDMSEKGKYVSYSFESKGDFDYVEYLFRDGRLVKISQSELIC